MFDVPDKKLAGLVYLSLGHGAGGPRDLLSHLSVQEDICVDGGLDTIMKILNQEYVKEDYVKADDAQARYERCRRQPHQRMEEYLRELRTAKRKLELEDRGSKISDVSYARKLLRKSGLTKLEQRQVLASAGAVWDSKMLEDALKLLYGDAHLDDRRRMNEMKLFRKGAGKGNKGGGRGGGGGGRRQEKGGHRKTYHQDEEEDSEEDSEEESEEDGSEATGGAAYHQDEEGLGESSGDEEDDEEAASSEEDDGADAEELLETYYQGVKAKKKLAAMGFSRKKDGNKGDKGKKKGKKGRCKDCKQVGHWGGDPECPEVKAGRVAPFKPKPKKKSHTTAVAQSYRDDGADEDDEESVQEAWVFADGPGEVPTTR